MNKLLNMKAFTLAGLLAVSLVATACNTVAGAGQDTSAAGNAITNTADKAKQ